MMRLKIYNELKRKPKAITRLALEYGEEKEVIYLVEKDETGEIIWYLLKMLPTGKFERCSGIQSHTGFQLDGDGRIKEEKE